MAKLDPKKTEHVEETHGISQDIVAIKNLKKIKQEKENELINDLLDDKQKTESKETFTKSLEFEKDTFKVDSKEWKRDRYDVYRTGHVNLDGEGMKQIFKVNATGDVVEYFEWPALGEQIFITYDAFIREVMKAKNCSKEEVEKKYLMTLDELQEKMKDKPSGSEEYKKFFDKEIKDHLAGWKTADKKFRDVGGYFEVWLADGKSAYFERGTWGRHGRVNAFGFSGRLLKN